MSVGLRYLPGPGEPTNGQFVDLVRAVLGLAPLLEEAWSPGREEKRRAGSDSERSSVSRGAHQKEGKASHV